jgi:NADH-quinone oxidoreductase subunit C
MEQPKVTHPMTHNVSYLEQLKSCLKGKFKACSEALGDVQVAVDLKDLVDVMTLLRNTDEFRFTQLLDVCVVDYLGKRPKRFEVVYHLLSMRHNLRVRVVSAFDEGTEVPSVTSVFSSAGWWEREAFDMFGVVFSGNADLRRILTDYSFEGHPLRKDFPLTGYVQMRYDEGQKKVIQEPVHLAQAYRTFDNVSPWKGMEVAVQESHTSTEGDSHGR